MDGFLLNFLLLWIVKIAEDTFSLTDFQAQLEIRLKMAHELFQSSVI